MFDVLCFFLATLSFLFMYHFNQPAAEAEKDPCAGKFYQPKPQGKLEHIRDSFTTFQSVSEAILKAGVGKARLVLGIDLTASNEWQGRLTFSRYCLHKLHPVRPSQIFNPYQRVINIIGKTLQPFTETGHVYAYGFGDVLTQDTGVTNIMGEESTACRDFREVLVRYNEMLKEVVLSGPTSFAPIIRKSMKHVRESGNKFHILVIIADGQMEDEGPTVSAIIEASKLPLSIVLVGVGDGPWDIMEEFDDHLPGRKFDNFQFVDFHSIRETRNHEAAFALAALMEIPVQYKTMEELGYFSNNMEMVQEEEMLEDEGWNGVKDVPKL